MVATEERRVRDFIAAVEHVPAGERRVMDRVLPELATLLGSEKASAYSFRREGAGLAVDYLLANFPLPGYAEELEREVRRPPASFLAYDPLRPERSQRNRVRVISHRRFTPAQRVWFARHGLDRADQLRILLCERSSLLAWVGALRDKPFTGREVARLRAVAPALRRRLLLERQLELLPALELLAPALEAIGAPAFLLRGQAVAHANAAAAALLERDPSGARRALLDHLAGRAQGGYRLTRHSAPGMPEHALAIGNASPADPAPRAAALRARWNLTPRQTEVLAHVAAGLSNKEIAAQLACSEPTVEFHITALFRKAQCEGRAALVARFWTAA